MLLAFVRTLAVASFCVVLAQERLHAQAAESPEYYSLIGQALAEHEAQHYAEARALFLRAHAVYSNARTLRGIGMMEFELRNYAESIKMLEAALASQVNPLEGALREATRELLARARSFVVPVMLTIEPVVTQLRVQIDGMPVAWTAGRTLELAVGEHTIEISAPGYPAVSRALSAKGGALERISVQLRPVAGARPAPASATQAMPGREVSSIWSSPWLWLGVSTALAGGIVGAALLVSSQPHQPGLERGDVGVDGLVTTLQGRR
jgi:hypothetical protein